MLCEYTTKNANAAGHRWGCGGAGGQPPIGSRPRALEIGIEPVFC